MTLTTLIGRTRTKLGDLTSTEYSDANITLALNEYYQKAMAKAITAGGQWQINGDIASTDIVNGQQEYTLTTSVPLLTLNKIEVNFDGSSNAWEDVEIVDMKNELEPYSNQTTYGQRAKAEIFDSSIMFLATPTKSVTNGLKIWYSKEAIALSTGTDVPNLVEEVQTYLVHGACLDYAISHDLTDKIKNFTTLLALDEAEIWRIYSNRLPAVRPQVKARNRTLQYK
jgi:hypothetical protein